VRRDAAIIANVINDAKCAANGGTVYAANERTKNFIIVKWRIMNSNMCYVYGCIW